MIYVIVKTGEGIKTLAGSLDGKIDTDLFAVTTVDGRHRLKSKAEIFETEEDALAAQFCAVMDDAPAVEPQKKGRKKRK